MNVKPRDKGRMISFKSPTISIIHKVLRTVPISLCFTNTKPLYPS